MNVKEEKYTIHNDNRQLYFREYLRIFVGSQIISQFLMDAARGIHING
jgi:hypothetical protein